MLFITPMRLAQVTVAHLKLKGSFDGPLLIQDFAQFDNWMLADLLPRASKIFDEVELASLAEERDAYIINNEAAQALLKERVKKAYDQLHDDH